MKQEGAAQRWQCHCQYKLQHDLIGKRSGQRNQPFKQYQQCGDCDAGKGGGHGKLSPHKDKTDCQQDEVGSCVE